MVANSCRQWMKKIEWYPKKKIFIDFLGCVECSKNGDSLGECKISDSSFLPAPNLFISTYITIYLFIIIIIIILFFCLINESIVLGIGHLLGGLQVPPSGFSINRYLPQFSRLLGRVQAIGFET